MFRRLIKFVLLSLALSLPLGCALLTRFPEAAIIQRAEDWPVLGPAARAFRSAYLRRAPEPSSPEMGVPTRSDEQATEARRRPQPPPHQGRIWVLPGTTMRASPSRSGEFIQGFGGMTLAHLIERRGDWYRVWQDGREGWVYLPDYEEPPLGSEPVPPGPLPPRAPEREQRQAAHGMFSGPVQRRPCGPYRLVTDVQQTGLLDRLCRLPQQLDTLYARRHGRTPLGQPAEEIVLYKEESAYRRLQQQHPRLAGLQPAGHSGYGLAVLYLGERSEAEVSATLVHELTHLISRRALGPALPPWLDEGIADDLAFSYLDMRGQLQPDRLGGERRSTGREVVLSGGLAGVAQTHRAMLRNRLPSLERLLSLDWENFVRGPAGALNYNHSALFIRYLVQGEGGRRAVDWRDFLDRVAAGEPAEGAQLRQVLGQPWTTLQAGFQSWLGFQATRPEFAVVDASEAYSPPPDP